MAAAMALHGFCTVLKSVSRRTLLVFFVPFLLVFLFCFCLFWRVFVFVFVFIAVVVFSSDLLLLHDVINSNKFNTSNKVNLFYFSH